MPGAGVSASDQPQEVSRTPEGDLGHPGKRQALPDRPSSCLPAALPRPPPRKWPEGRKSVCLFLTSRSALASAMVGGVLPPVSVQRMTLLLLALTPEGGGRESRVHGVADSATWILVEEGGGAPDARAMHPSPQPRIWLRKQSAFRARHTAFKRSFLGAWCPPRGRWLSRPRKPYTPVGWGTWRTACAREP